MKTTLRRGLDLLLYLTFCVMIGTGLLLNYKLPPRSQGLMVLGSTRHEWGHLHFWISLLFISLVLFHLILNWPWLVKCAAKGKLWKTASGLLAGLLIILGILILPTSSPAASGSKGLRKVPLAPTQRDSTQLPPSGEITYAKDVRPILETSCIDCHGSAKQRAGVRLDRLEDLLKAEDGETPLVTPGDANESRLVAVIDGRVRLKKCAEDHLLPPDQVALIRKWIDSGAR